MLAKKIQVGLTEEGRRCGQDHPRAKLTDRQVDQIREWHDSGLLGYQALSMWCLREFGLRIPKASIQKLVNCERRYALAMKFKTVYVTIKIEE